MLNAVNMIDKVLENVIILRLGAQLKYTFMLPEIELTGLLK